MQANLIEASFLLSSKPKTNERLLVFSPAVKPLISKRKLQVAGVCDRGSSVVLANRLTVVGTGSRKTESRKTEK